jgi:hypothetical protein
VRPIARRPPAADVDGTPRQDAPTHEALDRAGLARTQSAVVAAGDAAVGWRAFDDGSGAVMAADATEGYHGGGSLIRWVTDARSRAAVRGRRFGAALTTVRLMP